MTEVKENNMGKMAIRVNRLVLLVCSVTLALNFQAESKTRHSSGEAELDRIRSEVVKEQTSRETFKLRAIKMKLWVVTQQQQQQQGVRIDDYDADMLNNLYENALGGIPTNGTVDPAVLPVLLQSSSGLEYVHVQRNDDPGGK